MTNSAGLRFGLLHENGLKTMACSGIMKINCDISTSFRHVGEDAIRDLALQVPDGLWVNKMGFTLRGSCDDPRIERSLRFLKNRGCGLWDGQYSPEGGKNDYRITLIRKYSKHDYDACDFLVLDPNTYSEGLSRTSDGLIKLDHRKLKRKADFAKATPTWVVVSSRVKRLIEESPLKGISFRPTVLENYEGKHHRIVPWDRVNCEPFWEIYSEQILPRMAPWNDLREHPKTPGYFSHREGLYLVPEPHYRRSDVAALADSDLFGTHEMFDTGGDGGRMKIASRRFYLFCRAHELKVSWTPVRLDPDDGPEGGPLPHYPSELLEFLTPPTG